MHLTVETSISLERFYILSQLIAHPTSLCGFPTNYSSHAFFFRSFPVASDLRPHLGELPKLGLPLQLTKSAEHPSIKSSRLDAKPQPLRFWVRGEAASRASLCRRGINPSRQRGCRFWLRWETPSKTRGFDLCGTGGTC